QDSIPEDQLITKEKVANFAKLSFAKQYAEGIKQSGEITPEMRQETRGEWKKYQKDTDPTALWASLQNKGTAWCTKGFGTAQTQLKGGDFYVYYTLDKQGKPTIPRIAIRMQGNDIGEVRGVADNDQNLEGNMVDIAQNKMNEFPGAEKYIKKSADMKFLTQIDKKTQNNEELNKDELTFLYEIDSPIQGFGYKTDPRIKEIRSQRNPEQDMLIIFDCTKDQIAHNQKEINENTKAYVGELFPSIFQTLQTEHIYTEFPEGKIRRYNIEIGGKSKKELEAEMKKQNIIILGDGAWGTTLAILLSENGHNVSVWSAFPEHLREIDKKRENKKYLAGIKIPKNIIFEKDLNKVIEKSDWIIFAIPSKFFREVAQKVKQTNISLRGKVFVNVAKGLEQKTLKRMTEVLKDELGNVQVAVLSGPTIAIEVAKKMPAIVVAASKDKKIAKKMQEMFSNDYFRVYTSNDVVGVEISGPLKNIIAVVAGISDGLGFGANTKAAILTRGIVEIQRLGQKLGAKRKTFSGIAGLGDLSTTCISPESRNRTFGERIARGESLDTILKTTDGVIEGVTTSEAVYQLSKKYKVDMPLVERVYQMIYENKKSKEAVKELMQRKKKAE
ncbi:MAG TPA: NAD(P)H-dependent glycerol-3-phosphate dehydrogenase, partial [Candidatus Pacearchaeota archaeon]|nr:NAD(P)H-dependent glycerol-3-phosphate dehydrogenase [Candidatus Pacearchaeota archaeon]